MEGFDLYEEWRRDGLPQETVLAYRHGKFERQLREPGYRPVCIRVRNPRKLAQRRREKEIVDALCDWKRSNMVNDTPLPPTTRYLPQQMNQNSALPSASIKQPSERLVETPTPTSTPIALPKFDAVSIPRESGQPIRYLHTPPPRHVVVFGRPTYPFISPPPLEPLQRRIPQKIINLVNEIYALPPGPTGFPMRQELMDYRFRESFNSAGVLRDEGPLPEFKGDTRLFKRTWWQYLAREHARTH